MSRLVPIRSMRLVAFAAAMVIGGLAADRAEASCGGYVYVRGQRLHIEHSSMEGNAAAGNSTGVQEGILPAGHDGQAPQRVPCHGPTCSNGSIPPAAPVPSEPVSTDQWALSFTDGQHLAIASSSVLPASDVEPSEGFGLSIIRPPR